MNKVKKGIIFLFAMLFLVGCSGKDEPIVDDESDNTTVDRDANNSENDNSANDVIQEDTIIDFPFEYSGVVMHMNTEAAPVIEALGEPMNTVEAPSCAFQGLDKFYYYSGIEISTYPLDGEDYMYYVDFKDDTVETPEGIYIGSSIDEMIAAYGDDYVEETGTNTSYTYTLGETQLIFLVEEETISAITYMANVLE